MDTEQSSQIISSTINTRLERSKELYETSLYSDVTIRVINSISNEVTEFKSHKSILYTVSSVWEAALKWTEDDVIEMREFDEKVISCLLYFIYTSQICFESIEFCLDILKASDFYNMPDLADKCMDYIEEIFCTTDISNGEFVIILNKASLFKLNRLIGICFGFLEDKISFFENTNFMELSHDSIKSIVSQDRFICSEYYLIHNIFKWGSFNCQNDELRDFLVNNGTWEFLRFKTLHLSEMKKIIDDYPYLFKDNEINEMFNFYSNQSIPCNFLNSNTIVRGIGNSDEGNQIIVGNPPLTLIEEFIYFGSPIRIPIFCIEIEYRTNSYIPKCQGSYEASFLIKLNDKSIPYEGDAHRIGGLILKLSDPVQLQLQNSSKFKFEITLNRPGIYRKNSYFCQYGAGFMRIKRGLIRDINNLRESISSEIQDDL